MPHEILCKSKCRLGRVQVEDWSPLYPIATRPYVVALYAPLAETPSRDNVLMRRGESCRFAFKFERLEDANEMYERIRDGADPHGWVEHLSMSPYWTDDDTRHCLPH